MSRFPFFVISGATFVGLLLGYLASFIPTPQYEANAKIVILRPQIDNPLFSNEQSKNRWIWLRDGLAIEQMLLSDTFLETLSDESKPLKEWRDDVVSSDGHAGRFYAAIRRVVLIKFTGADSFSYIISARDSNADLAQFLVESTVTRMKFIVTKDIVTQFQTLLRQMNTRLQTLKPSVDGTEIAVLTEALERLRVSQTLFNVEATNQVQVVNKPFKPIEPVFPNAKSFAILGALAGLALSFVFLFLKSYFRIEDKNAPST